MPGPLHCQCLPVYYWRFSLVCQCHKRYIYKSSCLSIRPMTSMTSLDVLSLTLSFLGIYGLIFPIRYLIPCFFIPCLLAHSNATRNLLDQAEAIDGIPPESQYRKQLDMYDEYLMLIGFYLIHHCANVAGKPNLRRCVWRAIAPGDPVSTCVLPFGAS